MVEYQEDVRIPPPGSPPKRRGYHNESWQTPIYTEIDKRLARSGSVSVTFEEYWDAERLYAAARLRYKRQARVALRGNTVYVCTETSIHKSS